MSFSKSAQYEQLNTAQKPGIQILNSFFTLLSSFTVYILACFLLQHLCLIVHHNGVKNIHVRKARFVPWYGSNDTSKKSLITLTLNNRLGGWACLGGWALLGGLELQEKFPFLTRKKELEKSYLHGIVKKIEDNDIPQFLVLNLNQTPSKYIPVLKQTMALKRSETVPIKRTTDKRMITATFTIILDGHFLPLQLIYGGKTSKNLPRVNFPKSFSLSANPSITVMNKN